MKIEDIKGMEVTVSHSFTFDVQTYLEECKEMDETPSEKGFEEFCVNSLEEFNFNETNPNNWNFKLV